MGKLKSNNKHHDIYGLASANYACNIEVFGNLENAAAK